MENQTPNPLFVLLFVPLFVGGCTAWRGWIDDTRAAIPVACAAATAAIDAVPLADDAGAPPPPPPPPDPISPTLPLPPPKAQATR